MHNLISVLHDREYLVFNFLASKFIHKSESQSFSQLRDDETSVATTKQHLPSQDSLTSSYSSTTTDTVQSKQKYLPPSDVSNPFTTSIAPVVTSITPVVEKHLNDDGPNKRYSTSSVVTTVSVSSNTSSSPSQASITR